MSKTTRPIVFFALNLQFGAAIGFMQIAVPYWLSKEGLSLEKIGLISATAFMPHALKILWVPLIDMFPRRRLWYFGGALTTAALVGATSLIPNPAQHVPLLMVLLTAMQAATATASAASNALMATTTSEKEKGRAGGYYMAGNVGGTAILGAFALWLSTRVSPVTLGLIMGGIVIAAALCVLFVHEGVHHAVVKSVREAWGRTRDMAKDLWSTAFSRFGFTGLLLCALPVGCGALTNLFSAMATDYQASADVVAAVNGPGMGITGGLGSLLGGFLADKMNRRLTYALAGGLTALSALAMALAPMTPWTYLWGTLLYSFANGIAFAAFAAYVMEMVSSGAAVTTKYTLFVAVSNWAISYNTAFDGWASSFRNLGTRGTLFGDFALTVAGIAAFAVITLIFRQRKVAAPPAAQIIPVATDPEPVMRSA